MVSNSIFQQLHLLVVEVVEEISTSWLQEQVDLVEVVVGNGRLESGGAGNTPPVSPPQGIHGGMASTGTQGGGGGGATAVVEWQSGPWWS